MLRDIKTANADFRQDSLVNKLQSQMQEDAVSRQPMEREVGVDGSASPGNASAKRQ